MHTIYLYNWLYIKFQWNANDTRNCTYHRVDTVCGRIVIEFFVLVNIGNRCWLLTRGTSGQNLLIYVPLHFLMHTSGLVEPNSAQLDQNTWFSWKSNKTHFRKWIKKFAYPLELLPHETHNIVPWGCVTLFTYPPINKINQIFRNLYPVWWHRSLIKA